MNIDLDTLSAEQLKELTKGLMAKLEAASAPKALTFKVTQQKEDGSGTNGAISVYGLSRFPVTLYASQWERLFNDRQRLADFIKANASIIARK